MNIDIDFSCDTNNEVVSFPSFDKSKSDSMFDTFDEFDQLFLDEDLPPPVTKSNYTNHYSYDASQAGFPKNIQEMNKLPDYLNFGGNRYVDILREPVMDSSLFPRSKEQYNQHNSYINPPPTVFSFSIPIAKQQQQQQRRVSTPQPSPELVQKGSNNDERSVPQTLNHRTSVFSFLSQYFEPLKNIQLMQSPRDIHIFTLNHGSCDRIVDTDDNVDDYHEIVCERTDANKHLWIRLEEKALVQKIGRTAAIQFLSTNNVFVFGRELFTTHNKATLRRYDKGGSSSSSSGEFEFMFECEIEDERHLGEYEEFLYLNRKMMSMNEQGNGGIKEDAEGRNYCFSNDHLNRHLIHVNIQNSEPKIMKTRRPIVEFIKVMEGEEYILITCFLFKYHAKRKKEGSIVKELSLPSFLFNKKQTELDLKTLFKDFKRCVWKQEVSCGNMKLESCLFGSKIDESRLNDLHTTKKRKRNDPEFSMVSKKKRKLTKN